MIITSLFPLDHQLRFSGVSDASYTNLQSSNQFDSLVLLLISHYHNARSSCHHPIITPLIFNDILLPFYVYIGSAYLVWVGGMVALDSQFHESSRTFDERPMWIGYQSDGTVSS